MADNPISKPSKGVGPSLEELQQIYDQRSQIPAKFRDMSWSSWFRINSRMVNSLQVGRVFLGGDSAHIHSPAGAQGMNTGMQDMINLCWKLAMVVKGQAKPELLETYSKERLPVIRNVLKRTEGLNYAMGSESTFFRSVFNYVAPWLVSMENIQQNATEHMSQLALNYRECPFGFRRTFRRTASRESITRLSRYSAPSRRLSRATAATGHNPQPTEPLVLYASVLQYFRSR